MQLYAAWCGHMREYYQIKKNIIRFILKRQLPHLSFAFL